MPKMMAGSPDLHLVGIMFHALLNAPDGDGCPVHGPFSTRKIFLVLDIGPTFR